MQLPSLVGHTQEILGLILNSPRPADSRIDQFFRSRKYLGSHDRRFIAETSYGVLRHLRRCEWMLDQASRGLESEFFPEDRLLLLIAAFHIVERRQPPLTPADLIPRLRSDRLKASFPQILERMSALHFPLEANDAPSIGLAYSFPDWMVERFIEEFGLQAANTICSALNEPAPLTLRTNTLCTTRDACREILQTQGVEAEPARYSPLGLHIRKRMNIFSIPAFKEGLFEVQDEGSQILPLLIDPKPTAKLLDACAGAGGKTLEFAALMKNRGEIHATDVNGIRLEELKKRSRRAGASNIRIREVDDLRDLDAQFHESFDIVFVDAPCSGLGTIRRNPGMKWSVTPLTVDEVSQKQATILSACASLVKKNGRLVYTTCTLLRQENEEVIASFLAANAGFAPLPLAQAVERLGLSDALAGPWVKLLPHVHGTDGFFCAVLEKTTAS